MVVRRRVLEHLLRPRQILEWPLALKRAKRHPHPGRRRQVVEEEGGGDVVSACVVRALLRPHLRPRPQPPLMGLGLHLVRRRLQAQRLHRRRLLRLRRPLACPLRARPQEVLAPRQRPQRSLAPRLVPRPPGDSVPRRQAGLAPQRQACLEPRRRRPRRRSSACSSALPRPREVLAPRQRPQRSLAPRLVPRPLVDLEHRQLRPQADLELQ
jgi:hypothetical protein